LPPQLPYNGKRPGGHPAQGSTGTSQCVRQSSAPLLNLPAKTRQNRHKQDGTDRNQNRFSCGIPASPRNLCGGETTKYRPSRQVCLTLIQQLPNGLMGACQPSNYAGQMWRYLEDAAPCLPCSGAHSRGGPSRERTGRWPRLPCTPNLRKPQRCTLCWCGGSCLRQAPDTVPAMRWDCDGGQQA
jgi:hypothetical protein